MSDASAPLAKLREDPAQIEGLVSLGLDRLLERPIAELVDPSWLAQALADGLRSSARSDEFERWVATKVERALSRAEGMEGSLAERVPITLLGPLEQALGRAYQPDRELVRALLDHESTRTILREVLQANILEFGKRMRAKMPEAARISATGFASRLAGVAKGVASAVGGELERQLEPRVKAFVDDILGLAVDMMVNRVSSDEFAPEFARWRVDVLHALLGQPIERLLAERAKYPAQEFAADVAGILRALADWRGLTEELQAVLAELLSEHGGQSAGAFLEGSGLEQAWRPQLEQGLREQAQALVASDAFTAWFEELLT